MACIEQRSVEREIRLRRRPDGREDRTSARVASLTGMERASLRAVIRADCGCFLHPNKPAKLGALLDVLGFCSLGRARSNEVRNTILLNPGLTVECRLYVSVSDEQGITGVCCSDPVCV